MGIDFEAEGLLEGLEGEAREARLKLLNELEEQGFEREELREAAEEGRLVLLPLERQLGGEPRYTPKQMAEKSGVDREFLDRLWRSLGMPLADDDEVAYTDADLEAAKAAGEAREKGIPEQGLFEIARVMSQSMATVASAIGRVFAQAFIRQGDTEYDLARRYTGAMGELMPDLAPATLHVLNRQLRQDIRSAALDPEALAAGRIPGAEEVTIGFADLVGFTRLGERIPPAELGAVAERLDELASQVAEPPVRLVKMIGDAAMFASYNTDAILEATLNLIDAAKEEGKDFPELRAGVARGEALRRGGDWYGSPVNLASRLTGIAKPDSVLADETTKEAAEGDYEWSPAGKRRVRGVGQVRLFRVRHAKD